MDPVAFRDSPAGQVIRTASGYWAFVPAPLPPELPWTSDLVARLKPLHRRLEADLARTLRGDTTLQREVAAQCEELSRQQGVAVNEQE